MIDLLVVGAGIAGLHCALELHKKHPQWSITIADAYSKVGGRISTYTPPPEAGTGPRAHWESGTHWESGAGRYHRTHHLFQTYIKQYGLTPFPIGDTVEFRHSPNFCATRNPWPTISRLIYTLLHKLPRSVLATNTIKSLLIKIVGQEKTADFLNLFPYRSEVETVRADVAIRTLVAEMGTTTGFFGVKEGMEAIPQAIQQELQRSKHIRFRFHHRLVSLDRKEGITRAFFEIGDSKEKELRVIDAKRIILALPANALRTVSPFNTGGGWPILHHVTTRPLTRVYAVFPVSKESPVWFAGLPKTVTDNAIRHFIPINEEKGIAMISYTDGRDTLRKMNERSLLRDLRALFPERTIPAPLFLKLHSWRHGCSYWLPLTGHDTPTEASTLSKEAIHPFPESFPNLFVCGESFSMNQAWIEGALEHANTLLHSSAFQRTI
jgi:monoamine oxidase